MVFLILSKWDKHHELLTTKESLFFFNLNQLFLDLTSLFECRLALNFQYAKSIDKIYRQITCMFSCKRIFFYSQVYSLKCTTMKLRVKKIEDRLCKVLAVAFCVLDIPIYLLFFFFKICKYYLYILSGDDQLLDCLTTYLYPIWYK